MLFQDLWWKVRNQLFESCNEKLDLQKAMLKYDIYFMINHF